MIRLELYSHLEFRLSLKSVLPLKLHGLGGHEIAAIPLLYGKDYTPLGEFFRCQTTAEAPELLEIIGSTARIDDLGAGLAGGRIIVSGDAGHNLGAGMSGGTITVAGSVRHGAANGMRDGFITISGHAGDDLGSDLNQGCGPMSGGSVTVTGNVGDQAAHRLQRGTLLIGGNLGIGAASRMNGGTIAVKGRIASAVGILAQRGTILALGGVAAVPPSYADCGHHELLIHRLLGASLRKTTAADFADAFLQKPKPQRLLGDRSCGGMAEIWL
ncbi:MAG: formylmethanofuran dehydrogenase subunit C [Alphaproteobacteria bacterium]|nr:formylmethanofuran dehydrogenase subunit C [Alphaproteobacteria bacterium]